MGWQKSGSGTLYYVSRRTINGKTVTKYGGTGDAGRRAEIWDLRTREEEKLEWQSWNAKISIDKFQEKLVNENIKQAFIVRGYIQRHRKWTRIDRVRRPLTEAEITLIEHIKKTYSEPTAEEFALVYKIDEGDVVQENEKCALKESHIEQLVKSPGTATRYNR